jgi:hypothetical protein
VGTSAAKEGNPPPRKENKDKDNSDGGGRQGRNPKTSPTSRKEKHGERKTQRQDKRQGRQGVPCTQNSAYAERPTYKRRGLHIPSVPHIYKQQAVESCYFICQIKNGPSSRAIAEASFDFKPDGQSPDSPNRGSYM